MVFIRIYNTGLATFYYWNLYYLKSKNITIDQISYRVIKSILIKLNNSSKIVRLVRKLLTDKSNILRDESSFKDIIKGIIAPITLFFDKNIIFSTLVYSNRVYYAFLLIIFGKNVIYFTSWPYWNTNRYEEKPFFNKWIWNLFLKKVKIVTVSKTSCDVLKSEGYNALQIPHSVNLKLYKKDNKKNKKIRILYVGRLVEGKGIMDILEISSKFPKDKVEFLFAGEGPLVNVIKKSENKLPIKYLGYIKDTNKLNKIYGSSDIFVLNSYATERWEEWFGISLLEAMASSLPIIATDCVGPKEIMKDNKVGFLIPQKNKKELYNKLNILIKNKKLRTEFGRNGRKLVEEKYDIEKNSKKWLKILKL
ncbi:MAG: glycosyltransferase family 4 protein [Candidatus Nanoarchaeia archaeon]|jgi:glycosyltransferase involved in cell wall biosynthesis|nr:glycosyltransferase family 4 protein [Candidatus Nanoarchaeia archaeon]|tara:strand:+ start:36085 stop:37176 length:1092 start_codon:yes stop_codon:yes gene_type:complete